MKSVSEGDGEECKGENEKHGGDGEECEWRMRVKNIQSQKLPLYCSSPSSMSLLINPYYPG